MLSKIILSWLWYFHKRSSMEQLRLQIPTKDSWPEYLSLPSGAFYLLALWLVFINIKFTSAQEDQHDAKKTLVLFDTYHSNTWIAQPPCPELYNYHQLHGPARAAQALRMLGWEVDTQIEPWSKAALEDVDLIVFNLVSADRPPFLISEIQALKDYLLRGGGVIVITDHTNCYFHNHVLGAWFQELEITLTNHLACDKPPFNISDGNGWVAIESFAKHPVTDGLQRVAFQSGGSVDPKLSIAWMSSKSWGDEGNMPPFGEGTSLGFYGDFEQGIDEVSGPLGVIGAKTIGQGRMVIIGDQNCIGGMFLNYADNRRLWLQSALWAAGASTKSSEGDIQSLTHQCEPDRSLIWCLEPLSERRYYWSSLAPNGLNHAFSFLNKYADARATDRTIEKADWLIVPATDLLHRSPWQQQIDQYLAHENHRVIILGQQPSDPSFTQWIEKKQAKRLEKTPVGIDSVWELNSKSRVFWIGQGNRWSNSVVTNAETFRSEFETQHDEKLIEWMQAEGLKSVAGYTDHVPWTDP
jgi:hypothetical protein